MLILTLVTTLILVMFTRHRIWLYSVAAGALLAWVLWYLMDCFAKVLPPAWHSFNGVLAFLVVALVIMAVVRVQEKIYAELKDVDH